VILYSDKLKERSRELRKGENLAEVLMWQRLQKRQFLGLRFARQKPLGYYIADFYCHSAKVIIEIDGKSHDDKVEYDKERDEYMQAAGLKTIRIFAKEVLTNIDGVMVYLEKEMNSPEFPLF